MLLGAAKSMGAARAGRPEGPTVHFIFQPAEEGLAGARAMMDDGLFERFPCDEVYGVHNWPDAPFGTACVGAGPMMAASDKIEIEITGKGAHAAMPHKGVDPVLVASHVVTALQSSSHVGPTPSTRQSCPSRRSRPAAHSTSSGDRHPRRDRAYVPAGDP